MPIFYVFMCMNVVLLIVLVCLSFFGCQQTIELDLPAHQSQMAMEFYLEDGQPLRCTLQESVSFTALPLNPLISGAVVVLSYNGIRDTLKNVTEIDTMTRKIYNYTLPKKLLAQPNVIYELYVRDTKGRVMRGTTKFITPIKISKSDYVFNSKDSVSAGVFFTDPAGVKNYYQALAYKQKPRIEINERADLELPDTAFEGKEFGFYTDYVFAKKDTITMRLYSLLPEHFAYLESVEDAVRGNLNPFAQPALIKSTVTGGLGLFTTLNFDEKRDIILK